LKVIIHIVDAFTTEPGKGNRAGVVLEADGLIDEQMQAIARFAGFSETAFVLKPDDKTHDVHVRYFTPLTEVPVCGHATVATHFIRKQVLGIADRVLTAKTGAGNLKVEIEGSGVETKVIMTQGEPEFGSTLVAGQKNKLADALELHARNFHDDLPIQIVSTGHSKVMVPIQSLQKLDEIRPNMEALTALSREIGCNGFFVFFIEKKSKRFATYGRMFAPAIGILEDPVTGNANGPAGAYLAHYGVINFENFISYPGRQGYAMGKPGIVEVRLKKTDDQLIVVQVGGNAVSAGILEYTT